MNRAAPAQPALRNVCIIAHVDHGKTTLVDGMLKQSNIFRANQDVGELIMDSNALEREKGITILAKNTAVTYRSVKINIIDTPGHADFSGEVERVLNMADGCLLLVDAAEGPMPQTRYVLRKAFEAGLRPIVVINKVDRTNARPAEVLHLTQDLFLELATDAEQLDFPVLYAIGRDGRAGVAPDALAADLGPLFETILKNVAPPGGDADEPFQMLVASLDYDSHLGRIALGRVGRGSVGPGDTVLRLGRDDAQERCRVSQVFVSEGLKRVPVERAAAGEIVAVCGVAEAQIGDADRRHTRRRRGAGGARAAHYRRADRAHDVRREHLAVRRTRGQVVHLAAVARAPVPRAGDERCVAGGRDR
jgi:GTP-binding protein